MCPGGQRGIISCAWKPLAKIEVHPDQAATGFKRNHWVVSATVIDKDRARNMFTKRDYARASPPVLWSM
eukprot:7789381-Alexandrium_andersonii.AAC.1